MHWKDDQPIFRQLSEKIMGQIRDGVWIEGEALPSVRSVAADLKINHLTVMKSYQLLVEQGLVEKRRGQGMFVKQGAVSSLITNEKDEFLECGVPELADKLARMNMSVDELVNKLEQYLEKTS